MECTTSITHMPFERAENTYSAHTAALPSLGGPVRHRPPPPYPLPSSSQPCTVPRLNSTDQQHRTVNPTLATKCLHTLLNETYQLQINRNSSLNKRTTNNSACKYFNFNTQVASTHSTTSSPTDEEYILVSLVCFYRFFFFFFLVLYHSTSNAPSSLTHTLYKPFLSLQTDIPSDNGTTSTNANSHLHCHAKRWWHAR